MADQRLIFAEFYDDKPHRLVIDPGDGRGYDEYDVEYCRRDDECYADDIGGYAPGKPVSFSSTVDGKGRYWAADGVKVVLGWPEDRKKEISPPPHFRLAGLPEDWPAESLVRLNQARCYYCSLCDDWFPDDSYRRELCPHMGECRRCDEFSTEDEPCPCQEKRKARIERMRKGIIRTRMTIGEFEAIAKERFGEDRRKWKFVCPVCRREATLADWEKAGMKEAAGRTCLNHSDDFSSPKRCPVYGDKEKGGTADLLPLIVRFETTQNSYMELAPRPREPWPPTRATKPKKKPSPSGTRASKSRKRAPSTKR